MQAIESTVTADKPELLTYFKRCHLSSSFSLITNVTILAQVAQTCDTIKGDDRCCCLTSLIVLLLSSFLVHHFDGHGGIDSSLQ